MIPPSPLFHANPASTDSPLYGEQTKRTIENMSFSGVLLGDFPAYVRTAALLKKSCALANFRAGLLPGEIARAIGLACDLAADRAALAMAGSTDDRPDDQQNGHGNERNGARENEQENARVWLRRQFPVDVYHGGGGIGINMNLNEVLAALAARLAEPGGTAPDVAPVEHVNMSQSTSDLCHSALRLTLHHGLSRLDKALNGWIAALRGKADEFREVPTIARTCLQDGMAISSAALFDALASAMTRQKVLIALQKERQLTVNLGWTVVGTGTGASEAYRGEILPAMRETTGLDVRWRVDPLDAAQYPDDVAETSSLVARISQLLAKFSRDLRLLSSGPETGFAELVLPATQAGSSFFPGKVNPVVPEMMVQCALLVAAHDSAIQNALSLGEMHINLWEPFMGFALLQNMDRLDAAMGLLLERTVRGIELNAERCRQHAQSSIPFIVACKERYGYARISSRIKTIGLEATIAELRDKERETGRGEQEKN